MSDKQTKMQDEYTPEEQEMFKKIRDNFLICCVNRAGGRLEFPISEVDDADDLLSMTVEHGNLVLTTEKRS
jgi:hypothetical protein